MLIAYHKLLHGDLKDDIGLGSFGQALVGAEIQQLKRTSARNAVIADRSGHGIIREGR